ncbi:MAG: Uma2 family endonuclease [Planctomycetota bacterium]|nr:Uma2 family endonuclease [Planctomycetota bacterium]
MTALFTRRDYEALPETMRVHLLDGVLVKDDVPRFGHQRIQMRIVHALIRLLGVEHVAAAPVAVIIDDLNVFEPDIVVLEEPPPDDAKDVGVPLAVIEILSPSTRARDREFKTRRYLGLGVKEVWLVDPDSQSVEVFDLDGSRVAGGDESARSRAIEGFVLVPGELFARPDRR